MENITALLARHQPELTAGTPLIVDATDPALTSLLPSAHFHTDSLTFQQHHTTAQFAASPLYRGEDYVVIPLPKATERLRYLLHQLATQIEAPVTCWLVGPAKGGIKGAIKHLKEYATEVASRDSARHCKLYAAQLQPKTTPWEDAGFTLGGLHISSIPGVFCHGRLDAGTALLLEDLASTPLQQPTTALDVGCGAGPITATLAASGWQVTASDLSATALAACKKTLEHNKLDANVQASDMLAQVSGKFDLIISNPPFHTGILRDTGLAKRLITQSSKHLKQGGELRLVANRNLPYHDVLAGVFKKVSIRRETSTFRVWSARLPK